MVQAFLVLHIYHARAKNVESLLSQLDQPPGDGINKMDVEK